MNEKLRDEIAMRYYRDTSSIHLLIREVIQEYEKRRGEPIHDTDEAWEDSTNEKLRDEIVDSYYNIHGTHRHVRSAIDEYVRRSSEDKQPPMINAGPQSTEQSAGDTTQPRTDVPVPHFATNLKIRDVSINAGQQAPCYSEIKPSQDQPENGSATSTLATPANNAGEDQGNNEDTSRVPTQPVVPAPHRRVVCAAIRAADGETFLEYISVTPDFLRVALTEYAKRSSNTELLRDLRTALDDWVRTYASEMCNENKVKETRKRIWDRGGTLAYIADLLQRIDKTIEHPPAVGMVSVPVGRLANLVDWMRREQEDLTCSDLCDKSFEFQGCVGECVLDAGKKELDWWSNLIETALLNTVPKVD